MTNNLFTGIPDRANDEFLETLAQNSAVRVERIVSRGHCSPEGAWYDQDEDEWVVLLRGGATLAFEDGRQTALVPGDHVWIPAHTRHRVERTDRDTETVWLAVFARG